MFKNKSFLSLGLSQSFFNLADALYTLGVIHLIFSKTQSPLYAMLFPFLRGIMTLLSGMVVARLTKRISLHSLLILTQVPQALILLGLILYLTQYGIDIPVLLLFVTILAILDGWSSPSRNAMVRRIIQEKDLVQANSVLGMMDQTALFIGYSLGGLIILGVGSINSLWIPLVLLFASGLFCFFIKDPSEELTEEKKEKSWTKFSEAWSFVYEHPIYRRLFILDALEYIAVAAWMGGVALFFIKEVLHKGEGWWGVLNGAYVLGAGIGAFITLRNDEWLKERLKPVFIMGSANLGILTILYALSSNPIPCILLSLLMGIPYEMRDVALRTLMQTNASKTQQPLIFTAHKIITNISFAIGLFIMGAISEFYGPQWAYLTSAILVLLSAWMARKLPVKSADQSQKGLRYLMTKLVK